MLALDLRQTLVMLADAMRDARDPWWVISSAAVALHEVTPIQVADVDVLMSIGDARRTMARLGIMAGFYVATADGWTEVLPRTRLPVLVEGSVVYVPDRAELAAMLRLFGRPKDLERVRLLTSQI